MAKHELYTFRTREPNKWTCVKVDKDFNPTGTYEMSKTGTYIECSCFASNKPTCRHRQMIPEFEVEDRFNSHWFYSFDKGVWIEGPTHEN